MSTTLNTVFTSRCIAVCIFFTSCTPEPAIPIPDSLEISLRGRNSYSEYVYMLNKAALNDTLSLKKFFDIDYLGDGAGYDHGWVLIQLMNKLGDEQFSNALEREKRNKIDSVREYFRAGIDLYYESDPRPFTQGYPLTFAVLGIDQEGLY